MKTTTLLPVPCTQCPAKKDKGFGLGEPQKTVCCFWEIVSKCHLCQGVSIIAERPGVVSVNLRCPGPREALDSCSTYEPVENMFHRSPAPLVCTALFHLTRYDEALGFHAAQPTRTTSVMCSQYYSVPPILHSSVEMCP